MKLIRKLIRIFCLLILIPLFMLVDAIKWLVGDKYHEKRLN